MTKCLACVRGFTEECEKGGCSDEQEAATKQEDGTKDDEREWYDDSSEKEDERTSITRQRKERRNKPDSALLDQQSTGRKRAAKLYPLDRSAPCDWQGKTHCGGGQYPIRGCSDGLQRARHHGPDYNTLNNDPENVSIICNSCHNRWHAINDLEKEESYLIQYGHKPKQLGKRKVDNDE